MLIDKISHIICWVIIITLAVLFTSECIKKQTAEEKRKDESWEMMIIEDYTTGKIDTIWIEREKK